MPIQVMAGMSTRPAIGEGEVGAAMKAKYEGKDARCAVEVRLGPQRMPIPVRLESGLCDPETGLNESVNIRESESHCAEAHDLFKQHLHDMYIEVIHRCFSRER